MIHFKRYFQCSFLKISRLFALFMYQIRSFSQHVLDFTKSEIQVTPQFYIQFLDLVTTWHERHRSLSDSRWFDLCAQTVFTSGNGKMWRMVVTCLPISLARAVRLLWYAWWASMMALMGSERSVASGFLKLFLRFLFMLRMFFSFCLRSLVFEGYCNL